MTTNYYCFLKIFGLLAFYLYLGHILGYAGFWVLPIVLIICARIIYYKTVGINLLLKSILLFCIVAIIDTLIQFGPTGVHDHFGLSLIHYMTLLGLIPAYAILIKKTLDEKAETKIKNISILIFPTLLAGYYVVQFGMN